MKYLDSTKSTTSCDYDVTKNQIIITKLKVSLHTSASSVGFRETEIAIKFIHQKSNPLNVILTLLSTHLLKNEYRQKKNHPTIKIITFHYIRNCFNTSS